MRILHIFSQKALDPLHVFLGSTKDIRCRTEYFENRQIPFDELVLETRDDSLLMEKLKSIKLDQYNAVFIEYPNYPRAIAHIKQVAPEIKVIIRAHNAELLHNLDYVRAAFLKFKYKKILRYIGNAVTRYRQEKECSRLADAICSISSWEASQYWPHIASREKIYYLPYFLANYYLEPSLSGKVEKKNQCICMLSTAYKEAYFVMDAADHFIKEVKRLKNELPGWSFFITGKSKEGSLRIPPRIQDVGLLQSPMPILSESKAMAILSNYGYGFKTKILEAIMAGCYILLPKGLYGRMPEELQPYCFIVDKPPAGISFRNALSACEEPFPENNINENLRNNAYKVLDNILELQENPILI